MRVLMPSRILDRQTGGNTTYAREIANGLVANGIQVDRIPASSRAQLTALRETWAGLQRGAEGDVLHYVADTGPLLGTRRPTVVTVHGVASRWIDVARTPRQERVWRTRVQRAIDAADHVVTVSHSSARDIEAVFGVEPSRLTAIEHGIDLPRFATPQTLSPELKARLPERFALYLGNIEPRKNLIALVDAFSTSAVRALRVPLVVAGKPAWNSDQSVAAIDGADNVLRLGFVSDADRAALMQACTAFVFPSHYEGFGFPVVEALAAGAVVVASTKGSLAEVAGPSLRFDDVDVRGIAAGIERALTDEDARSHCFEHGRSWAARYTWNESVRQHISVYEGIVR